MNELLVPFNRAVRIGNFKLWRSRVILNKKTSMECVNVSNLDGSWCVRIPETEQMFSYICSQYSTTDENIREKTLGVVFANMLQVCLIPSAALHDAFGFLVEMMKFPYNLLPEKEMEKRMLSNMKELGVDKRKAKDHVEKMLDLRRQLYELIERKKANYIDAYEKQQRERWAKEEDELKKLEQDELAEQAMDILNKEENAS